MEIIGCPACNGKVSTEAAACPHCGHPVKAASATAQALQVSVTQEAPGFWSGVGNEVGKSVGKGMGCLLVILGLILALLHSCS